MPKKTGRPSTDRSRAAASKERALAHLRWLQVRERRRELKRVVDVEASWARALAMLRDRLLAVPDRLGDLAAPLRERLQREIAGRPGRLQ